MTIKKRSLRRRNIRRGSIVVLVAACLIVIMAFVAIAIDGGVLVEQRRKSQATADAAALAAATDLFNKYPVNKGFDAQVTATAAAQSIAAANGYANDETTSIVTTRTSPQTYLGGPYRGQMLPKGYAEVTVQYNQNRYFSSILGTGTIPVQARSVARGKWEPTYVGILVLDLHASGALRATGGGAGTVTGGAAVIVNSDAIDAAITTGGSILTATDFAITGGTSGGGFVGEVTTGALPQPDPLRNLPQPKSSDYVLRSNGPSHFSNGNKTLSPGVYSGGITISGQANVYMQPGIYYMDGGGFSMTGQGNLTAFGVMIYNDPKGSSDSISISGSNGGSVTLTPPTSGLYQGLTLFQNRTAPHDMNISGNGGFYVTGTFYTANSLMNVTGNGAAKIGSQYISRLLDINGSGGLLIDYNPDTVVPRRILGLVE
jgi:Flp pilus assembly protein TadG